MVAQKERLKQIWILFFIALAIISCGTRNKSSQNIDTLASKRNHPTWIDSAIIYEVNIRQFSSEGTFEAFAQHLPRLKDLGIDILWFMPIQPIGTKARKGTLGSYYSIKNYVETNPEFGTLDDFKSVVKAAHATGMKVILDWVANHTSRDAIWIEEGNRDWYFYDETGNISVPYDWTDVAKLNYENEAMRKRMIEAMRFWIRETDIDGFRCDVAGEVPTDFWCAAKPSLTTLKSDIFMLAEAEKPELNKTVFDAYYAWDFHHKMNAIAQGTENVDSLRRSFYRMLERFPAHAIPMLFTSNHDENSWNGTEFERMRDAAATCAALTYMLPGIPLIYNGQEVGFNRRLSFFEKDSIKWETNQKYSEFYRSLNRCRKSNSALWNGTKGGKIMEITNNHPQKVWTFKRKNDSNEVICIFNLSDETVDIRLDTDFQENSYRLFPKEIPYIPTKQIKMNAWEYIIFHST